MLSNLATETRIHKFELSLSAAGNMKGYILSELKAILILYLTEICFLE
jgi:hypothetical protein